MNEITEIRQQIRLLKHERGVLQTSAVRLLSMKSEQAIMANSLIENGFIVTNNKPAHQAARLMQAVYVGCLVIDPTVKVFALTSRGLKSLVNKHYLSIENNRWVSDVLELPSDMLRLSSLYNRREADTFVSHNITSSWQSVPADTFVEV
jgi:hypothetical protein